jgi:hypothetical protein
LSKVLWDMTPCRLEVEKNSISMDFPEDGNSNLLRNVGKSQNTSIWINYSLKTSTQVVDQLSNRQHIRKDSVPLSYLVKLLICYVKPCMMYVCVYIYIYIWIMFVTINRPLNFVPLPSLSYTGKGTNSTENLGLHPSLLPPWIWRQNITPKRRYLPTTLNVAILKNKI